MPVDRVMKTASRKKSKRSFITRTKRRRKSSKLTSRRQKFVAGNRESSFGTFSRGVFAVSKPGK
jgi:hypothetical protein